MFRRLSSIALTLLLTLSLAAPAMAATATTTKKKPVAKKPTTVAKAAPKKETPEAFPAIEESGPPSVHGAAAIVVDAQSGRVLFEHNADEVRPVASTQKLLTGLIIAEDGGLTDKVRVAASDTYCEPSKLYIKSGEVYTRGKLLEILLVKSMNDVARTLARDNAGSVEAFAERMNTRAAQLGMRSSNFVNPNGLPAPGQYSTARDLAKLAMAAYRNRTIRSLVSQKTVTWRFNDGRVRNYETTNKVLRKWPLCNGMKTGYTNAAGHCLISSASYGGRDVISIILGDRDKQLWNDSYKMLAWGLSF